MYKKEYLRNFTPKTKYRFLFHNVQREKCQGIKVWFTLKTKYQFHNVAKRESQVSSGFNDGYSNTSEG